ALMAGTPQEAGGDTSGLGGLEAYARAEAEPRKSRIDRDADPIPLRVKQLAVKLTAARGNSPVDVAHIVARGVRSGFGVVHATAAKRRPAQSGCLLLASSTGLTHDGNGLVFESDQLLEPIVCSIAHDSGERDGLQDAVDQGCAVHPARL